MTPAAADVPPSSLPSHYELTRARTLFSGVSIATAFLLLALLGVRVARHGGLWEWWALFAWFAGMAVADVASAIVHWGADTWGRDDLPLIGRRLLVPFRVHHLNPEDFLRRRFVDTNGDVAFLAVPLLAGFLAIPLDAPWGAPLTMFGLGFCGAGMLTNQIHQWAHMPSPPAPIRALQDCGLILGRRDHAAHHDRPYDCHYGITTGWCNRPLDAIGFFRHLEGVVTRATGLRPRQDDRRYEERYDVRAGSPDALHG